MNKQKLFSILSLLGVMFCIALVVAYTYAIKTRGEVVVDPIDLPNDFAGEFSRVTTKGRLSAMKEVSFLAPSGEEISWDHFDGEYLLVNFWASWCAPCVVELPSLEKLSKAYGDKGLQVIAVSLDMARTHAEIKEYLYNRNLGEFAAYFDESKQVQKGIAMRGIPTTYLLDPKGNVLHVFEGDANWASPTSYAFFDALLEIDKN